MGSGTSSGRTPTMAEVQAAVKAERDTRSKVTRANRAYLLASGAYIGFDYEQYSTVSGTAAADAELAKRRNDRDDARSKLHAAEQAHDKAESDLQKIQKRYRGRQSGNAPQF